MVSASSSTVADSPFSVLCPCNTGPPFRLPSLTFYSHPTVIYALVFSHSVSTATTVVSVDDLSTSFRLSVPSSARVEFAPWSYVDYGRLDASTTFLPDQSGLGAEAGSAPSLPSSLSFDVHVGS